MVLPVLLLCLSYVLSGEAWSQHCRACQPSSWFRQCRLCHFDYTDNILPLPDLDLWRGEDHSETSGKHLPLVDEKNVPEAGGEDLPPIDEKDLSEVDKKDIPVEGEKNNKKIVSESKNSTNQENNNSPEDCDASTDLKPCYPVPIDVPSVNINPYPTNEHRSNPHYHPRQYTYYWTPSPRPQKRNAVITTENITDITDDTTLHDASVSVTSEKAIYEDVSATPN